MAGSDQLEQVPADLFSTGSLPNGQLTVRGSAVDEQQTDVSELCGECASARCHESVMGLKTTHVTSTQEQAVRNPTLARNRFCFS